SSKAEPSRGASHPPQGSASLSSLPQRRTFVSEAEGMGRSGSFWGILFLLGCAGVPNRPSDPAAAEVDPKNRYVSFDYGFEIERPPGDDWEFTEGKSAPEGIAIPVTVVHPATGSQVVVQVAP